jgi:hypothetical protein
MRTLRSRAVALSIGLSLCALGARADDEIWVWTTADGAVHYTDEQGRVPEAFREAARVAHREGGGSYQRVPQAAPLAANDAAAKREAALEAEVSAEASWRARARDIEERTRDAEARVEACAGDHFNNSPGDGSRKRRAEREEAERCAKASADLAQAQAERVELEDSAHQEGIPPGWLRVDD